VRRQQRRDPRPLLVTQKWLHPAHQQLQHAYQKLLQILSYVVKPLLAATGPRRCYRVTRSSPGGTSVIPYIAVSANKHANYKSDSKCNNTAAATNNWGDYCYGSETSPFRFPIDPSRNVGSRFTALLGCVGSNKKFAGNGRTECFYSERKPFAGWHVVTNPSLCSTFPDICGATPYYDILNSDKFEYLGSDGGPGPAAYSAPTDPGDGGGGFGGCADPTQIWCSDR
jgi:hypothetical protein